MQRPVPIETLEDVRMGGHHLSAICRHANCRYRKEVDVSRLIQRVGARQCLVPARAELHFTDQMRCPSCKRRGMNLWLRPNAPTVKLFAESPPAKQANFTIVDCGRVPYSGHDVIATADNLMVGKGAWAAAALFYGDRRITLKQGAFVVADSKDGKPIDVMTAERYTGMREGEAQMAGIMPRPKDTKAS